MPGKQRPKPRVTRREKKAQTSALVKTANEAQNLMSEMQDWSVYNKYDLNLKIEYKSSENVDENEMDRIFHLLKCNMQQFYEESDWGWNELEKKKELTDRNAKYLIVKNTDGELVAFSHFQFDVEVNQPVLYCYELQIDSRIQRKGVGRHLMNILFLIAYRFKLAKIMLTVFKDNVAGVNFYMKSLSFRRDETCPYEEEGKCYIILSKFIDKSEILNIRI